MLITRGSDGMALFEPGRPTLHIPIYGSDQVADVTGAGDTVIATFTLALAAGASPAEASLLANYAGGIVVMKRGTATVSAAELRARWPAIPRPALRRRRMRTAAAKVGTLDEVARARERGARRGPHRRPRQRLLRRAARRPRALPRRARGRRRTCWWSASTATPRCGGSRARAGRCCRTADRALLVAALRDVDHVVVFEEDDVTRAAAARCGPDVHCKGTDYTPETVPEREVVRSYGGRVAIVGDPKDHDTRALLARIRAVKALIVRLSAIGDVVHTLPVAGGAAAHGCEVGWVVEPRGAAARRGQPRSSPGPSSRRRRAPFRPGARAAPRVRDLRARALRRGPRPPGPVEVRGLGARCPARGA